MNTTNMTLATLLARLEALESSSVTVEAHTESVNALWVLCAGIMCFLLQAGFGMLEARLQLSLIHI